MSPTSTIQRVSRRTEVAGIIRDRIRSRRLVSGDRLPSFAEMRREFGTSPSTVDQIYTILAEEGVVQRRNGVGIYVAGPPRPVASGLIGFVLEDEPYVRHSQYWMSLVEGARAAAEAAGKNLVLLPGGSALLNRVDGVLIPCPGIKSLPPDTPTVSIIECAPGTPGVVADEAAGITEAVQHLLWLGHRRIGYLSGECDSFNPLPLRLAAYYETLAEAGIAVEQSWVRRLPNSDEEGRGLCQFEKKGLYSLNKWMLEDGAIAGCTAIICQNDHAAIGAIEALQDAGFRVPDDISVVGFDGTELGRLVTPKLTTVEMPLREIGMRGTELLLQLIAAKMEDEPPVCGIERFPVRVRVRASTGPVRRR